MVKENNAGIEENKKELCTHTCLKNAVFLQKYSLISFQQTIKFGDFQDKEIGI